MEKRSGVRFGRLKTRWAAAWTSCRGLIADAGAEVAVVQVGDDKLVRKGPGYG